MLEAPSSETVLETAQGHSQTLDEWLTVFNLLAVVLDPYTHQSGWIIPTAIRIFDHYEEADVRCAFVITGDGDGARKYLGKYANENLVLVDPARDFVKALGLEQLPALVHIGQDRTPMGAAQGWMPQQWGEVLETLEAAMDWRSKPLLPAPDDPGAFEGTPALG